MKILVLMRMVPDIVEELDVAPDGKSLDLEFLRLIVSERDDTALEQALAIKDDTGAEVTVVAPDAPEVDDVLFTALAKGVDRVVKVDGVDDITGTHLLAGVLAATLPTIPDLLPVDLVLTGSQAIGDLDGVLAPLLAEALGMPYVGLITGVDLGGAPASAVVTKEYAGGVLGRFEVSLPAVLGIQGSEKPPRYVPIAKVRAAMSSGEIETVEPGPRPEGGLVEVAAMAKPEVSGKAEMLEGAAGDVAAQLAELLARHGLV
jgi:electron transfer flavoprotein beta subunit